MIMRLRCSRAVALVTSSVVLGVFGHSEVPAAEGPEPTTPQKAVGSVALQAPTTPLAPQRMWEGGSQPAVDVSALSIRSDGSRITFAATLKAPPGLVAAVPVTIYIDSDNNPATGPKADPMWEIPAGFEYKAELHMCVTFADESQHCDTGGSKAKPTNYDGAMNLERFKGDSYHADYDTVVVPFRFPPAKTSARLPVKGQVVESSIEYEDLGAKPGQTIRLLAKKSGGGTKPDPAFPVVLLTLK
jgi:hypothetical protein